MWYAQVIGYLFAVVVGYSLIKLVGDPMWELIGWKKADNGFRPDKWQPLVVGVVERVLYVATLQAGRGEFIGVWLALKVAGQWRRWSQPAEPGIPEGRSIYQNFLIGNGLSILYALVGFKLIEWIASRNTPRAVAIPTMLVISTITLWSVLRRIAPSTPGKEAVHAELKVP